MNLRRRALLSGVAAGAVATPLHELVAQPIGRRRRIALIFDDVPLAEMEGPVPSDRYARAFVLRLSELGWTDGSNLVIERRSTEDHPERLPALMREMVTLRVDAIVVYGEGTMAASNATASIPIVAIIDNPEGGGFTKSLSRPTRNVTGLTTEAGLGMDGKRLQLLKEVAPSATRVAVIDFKYIDARATPGTHARRLHIEAAARKLDVTPIHVGVDRVEDIEPAFRLIVAQRADALFEMGHLFRQRQRVVEFAASYRLPAMYSGREYVELGGLMAYGTSFVHLWRRMAEMTDRILRGSKPADLPFEQPTHFELVINAKTAKTLGLTLPASLLLRADEVIH